MVDPDQISTVEGDGVSAPDVVRVEFGDLNILNDNIADADHAETLAHDLGIVLAHNGLVAGYGDAEETSIVVCERGVGRVRLEVGAPAVLVDGKLAGSGCAPGSTTGRGRGSLGSGEVVGSIKDDDTGTAVTQVAHELGGGRGEDSSGRATSSDALGETLSGTCSGLTKPSVMCSCGKGGQTVHVKLKLTSDIIGGRHDAAQSRKEKSSSGLHDAFFLL